MSKRNAINNDHLGLQDNPHAAKMLAKYGEGQEMIFFSDFIVKINRRNKEQTRVLVMTDKAVYNLKPTNYAKCKRRIPYNRLVGTTLSTASTEFVLHVPEEYDYRYKSDKKEDICELLGLLIAAYAQAHQETRKKLPVQYINSNNLRETVVTRVMARKQEREDVLRRKTQWEKHDSDDEDRTALESTQDRTALTLMDKSTKLDMSNFELIKVLGRGSFGKVLLVRKKADKQLFAMKIMRKKNIVNRNQVDHTKAERQILESLNHPFLMRLRSAFQTKDKLYLVLDYYKGGELFFHLKNNRRFKEEVAKMFIGEISLALGHLHTIGVIYRDLKPENILLDNSGHICLTDFGLSKNISDTETNTFCGTPEYLAPEMVAGLQYDKGVDWWSVGILLYELTVGIPPFYSQNINEMYARIQHGILRFPPFLTPSCRKIIEDLLRRDPKERLGHENDIEGLKRHVFFKNIDWAKMLKKELDVGYVPKIAHTLDTSNFDTTFTKEPVVDSLVSQTGSSLLDDVEFGDFTFNEDEKKNLV